MSEQDNTPEAPEEINTPPKPKKKKIIKILIGATILSVCAFGINNYISYKHQAFLEKYSNAIADIKNKNRSGYKTAFKTLKKLSDENKSNPSDYYYLGYLYQYGLGTQKDYSNAYKYFKKANTAQAYYQIAILYRGGLGVNKDNNKAIEYFKKSYEAGDQKAIITLAKLLESNHRLISITDPKLVYQIYLAYKSGHLTEKKPDEKNKYLATATAEGYEPAIIEQAQNFTKNGDYYRALMLWQTLLYSSDAKVADLAKKEIAKSEDLVRQQRQKELKKQKSEQIIEKRKLQEQKKKNQRQKQIEYKRKVGLSIPKQALKNLNGLIYINLFNTNKDLLQNFYKDIAKIEISKDWIINSESASLNYINNFLQLSSLKYNRSSLRVDFGDETNTNKYEGLIYYFYNDKDRFTQNLVNTAMKNKPKDSSLTPKLNKVESATTNDENIENKNIKKEKLENPLTQIENKKAKEQHQQKRQKKENPEEQIKLTYKEKVQRMQVFAQKGDYRQLYKLKQTAKSGDVYAVYYLGKYYYNIKDYKKAIKYYNEAADKNYGPAYYKLGNLYYDEQRNGVSYNKEKAIEYYKKAASLGVKDAEHILMLIK